MQKRAIQLLVIIMVSGLSQLLGLNAKATPVQPRQVNLSGNLFKFSMPENFSRNMPAENMVEGIDIHDLKKFNNGEYGNIIRRWWDIKKPSFFGKELGTVMMDISVQPVPENRQHLIHSKPYDITDRLDFMMMVYDQTHQRFDPLNHEAQANGGEFNTYHFGCCSLLGEKILSHYRDHLYGNQKWLGYSVAAPLNQLIVGLVLPLTKHTYLEVQFTYSPNQNVLPREFLDVAYGTTRLIENSLHVEYQASNEIKKLVEQDWITQTNDQVMAAHREAILVPLFGPDVQRQIAEGKEQALELKKELDGPSQK
jgi:hypothetical protein